MFSSANVRFRFYALAVFVQLANSDTSLQASDGAADAKEVIATARVVIDAAMQAFDRDSFEFKLESAEYQRGQRQYRHHWSEVSLHRWRDRVQTDLKQRVWLSSSVESSAPTRDIHWRRIRDLSDGTRFVALGQRFESSELMAGGNENLGTMLVGEESLNRRKNALEFPDLGRLFFGLQPMTDLTILNVLQQDAFTRSGKPFKRTVTSVDGGVEIRCEFDTGEFRVMKIDDLAGYAIKKWEDHIPDRSGETRLFVREIEWAKRGELYLPHRSVFLAYTSPSSAEPFTRYEIELSDKVIEAGSLPEVSTDTFGRVGPNTTIKVQSGDTWETKAEPERRKSNDGLELLKRKAHELKQEGGFLTPCN